MDNAKRVINGTWGEVWLDSEKIAECYGLQAKLNYNKETITLCGSLGTDTKITSYNGTGSLRLHKVNSRLIKKCLNNLGNGKEVRFTIISKLADPDSYGSERILIKNVSFDDLTLADWEAGAVGKVEAPFTFTKAEALDLI